MCPNLVRGLTGALLALWPASACLAQTPAEFYKSKTIELDIGFSVGGAYDAYARILARTMGKYIPGNPAIVPKNMEGAGSMRMSVPSNWMRLNAFWQETFRTFAL